MAKLVLFFLLCRQALATLTPTGSIAGYVIDAATRSPLPGASVTVVGTELGAAADAAGRFVINRVPVGIHTVEASMIGYAAQARTNSVVSPGRQTELSFRLSRARISIGEVTVRVEHFPRVKDAAVSQRNFAAQEIEIAPGGLGDIQRVVQAMPSVVSSGDQDNEVIVRGGSHNENLFLIDGIEIPYPNHFGSFAAQGGPVNILNPLLVREVDFVAGAFPARYGGRASSVMDISLKRGSLEELDGSIDMGMAGLGVVFESPLPGRTGSFIGSYHKSFLELMARMGVWGMSAVPYYDNALGKVILRPWPGHEFSLLGLWGSDHIYIGPGENVDENTYTIRQQTQRYAGGFGWQSLFGNHGYGRLLLSTNSTSWNAFVHESTDVNDTLQSLKSSVGTLAARYDAALRLAPGQETQTGVMLSRTPADMQFFLKPSPFYRYLYNPDSSIADSFPVLDSAGNPTYWTMNSYGQASSVNLSAYLSHRIELGRLLDVTAGLRLDRFGYTGATSIAPRLGIATHPLFGGASLHAGWGWHFQPPEWYILFADTVANRNLRDRRSDHYVVGIERRFGQDIRLSLEGFVRRSRYLPIPYSATTPDTYDYPSNYLAQGRGGSEGLELFVQKKHAGNWHGSLAYSLSRSWVIAAQDSTIRYPGDYDYRHILTAAGTYTIEFHKQQWYQHLPGWFRSTIGGLLFSDVAAIGLRWRYLSGRPYTEPSWNPEIRRWIAAPANLNNQRYPDYHRLDIRWDHKFLMKRWSLNWYLEIQNVYGRRNVWMYQYNDGNPDRRTVYGLAFWPMAGMVIEF